MTTPTTDLRTIGEVAPLVAEGVLSPLDLVRGCLERIEACRDLNAFITVLAEPALAQAAQAVREISTGRYRGPLHGIPVSIKDLIDLAGTPTTSGSAVPPLRPTEDAPIVRRLRDAGAIIIGKTNLHEFAFGTTTEETAFGVVGNPYDRTRSAGGSSSGAAVALVEGMCFGSIGTDTGGSIRIPSAACGTVGLKPAYGELPCERIVPLSTTCDHVGPMARSVADVRLLFEALSHDSSRSATSSSVEAAERRLPSGREAGRFAFGVPAGYLLERLDTEVRSALEAVRSSLAAGGHTVQDVEIRHASCTPDVYLHIVLPEASQYHASLLELHAAAYSPGVRLRLEMGRYLLAEDYVRAQHLRARLTTSVDRALTGCDALLLPGLAIPAPPLGAAVIEIDGKPEPVRAAMLRLTRLFNLTGHPAIALPAGRTGAGLPVGMQLVGRRGDTFGLLRVAEAVERQIAGGVGSVGGGTG